ncbi:hypothetical protein MTsPCn5_24930 [Croceitalea sp. MTPC5]|uniref:T9SS type B sorting domain-containing protein n=1 Tax=Croceitalea sp. MTPC5 TaxID=3056565 RepID=UPI002B39E9E3|nr:hypothetical protein MTsPCn5_24930 [Croceitalea sp. MTPC5]
MKRGVLLVVLVAFCFISFSQTDLGTVEKRDLSTGQSTTMMVNVGRTQNTYQWFKDGAALFDDGRILGSQSASLTISLLNNTDTGVYTCKVSGPNTARPVIERNPITLKVVANCDVTNRAALMALYDATNGPNWTVNTNWGSALPIDQWHGVTTDANGCVTQLILDTPTNTGNNLVGTIPAELGNLTELIDLDLSDQGGLSGTIPDSFGSLVNLEVLLLNDNQLSGAIPDVLGGLGNLTTLWLSQNMLVGTIPVSLGNLTDLESLLLSDNQLTGTIPTEFGNLNNLMTLWLSRNQLSGGIPEEMGLMADLQVLLLNSNQFTGPIPDTLYDLVNLTRLFLNNNQLEGAVSARIGDLTSLEILLLSDNQLSGNLPVELGNLTMVFNLGLADNLFTGVIPDSFGNLVNLASFTIANNTIEGVLPPGLIAWTNISNLNISNNNLEGDIPSFIFSASGTSIFNFNDNRFQFGDFEDEFNYYQGFPFFDDNPQARVNNVESLTVCTSGSITLQTTVSGSANVYEWFKDGVAIPASNTPNLVLTGLLPADSGIYTCLISSTIVTDLVLERNPITLTVTDTGPVANTISDISTCDDNMDGFAAFALDLAAIEMQVLGGQTGLSISYFDAMGVPITLTPLFTNTTAGQQDITVRVEASPNCFDETIFSLIVEPAAVAEVFADVEACISEGYTLPALNANNTFYTGPNATGTPLNTGTVLNTTQTVYVFAETGSAGNSCTDESSFEVTISGTPVAVMQDVEVCESYTLPTLEASNQYFTAPNGGGMLLNAGDMITTTQLVYIYTDGVCSDESSFMVEVLGNPTADVFEDITACNNYVLPLLSEENNYYTAPNQGGDLLLAGDEIVTSQTLYIYVARATEPDCFDESSFDIAIIDLAVTALEDVVECTGFTLPSLPAGENYYTGPDGSGVLLNAGDEVTDSQTLYIFSQSGGCTAESSFTITITSMGCQDDDAFALPKFFTPNNDDRNDVWDVSNLAGTGTTTIYIFDRYGRLLKKLDPNSESSWDGLFNGNPMPSSDYWFQYVNQDTGRMFTGHFSLKR